MPAFIIFIIIIYIALYGFSDKGIARAFLLTIFLMSLSLIIVIFMLIG